MFKPWGTSRSVCHAGVLWAQGGPGQSLTSTPFSTALAFTRTGRRTEIIESGAPARPGTARVEGYSFAWKGIVLRVCDGHSRSDYRSWWSRYEMIDYHAASRFP